MTYTTSSIGNPLGNGLLTEPLTTYRDDSMNSNAFNWSGPSQIAKPLKQKSKAKAKTSAERAEHVLSTRHGGMYSKAVPARSLA